MDTPDDRVAALIAAAAADELTPAEAAELDEVRRTHPWVDQEIADMREISLRLALADVTWTEVTPSDELRDRVASTPGALSPPSLVEQSDHVARRRAARPAARQPRRWLTPLVGAACVAIGIGVGLAVPALVNAPPSGGPGTLGAVEKIDVRQEPTGVQIDAALVAHTWGTEAVVDATGLEVGSTYSVVLIDADGTEFSAGQMLGSSVPIHCRLNAAVMRQEAVRLEVREAGTDDPTAVADLPEA